MRSAAAFGVVSAAIVSIAVNVRALPAVPTISAVALPSGASAIEIDGVLSEDVWKTAPVVTGFVQREPSEGAAPTHGTEVRVAFDASALYVAVTALEPEPAKIVGHLTRRDDSSPSDWVRVMIDSYHDRRSAFEFAVNAAGVKQDLYRFNDTNSDGGWDAVWDVAVSRNEKGWRAEFRIPFSQLRFNPGATGTFGFAVVRSVAHVNETSTWPLLAKSAPGYVSSFGDLTGLTLTGAQKRLELAPYAVGQMTTAPVASGNPLAKSPDPDATAGLDLKYKIARGLTLTGTVNPDFGQVEADPAVVNLGAFETFFAERRPFFVEGSGNFSFNIDCNDGNCTGLFYSRRIGRSPHLAVDAPANGYEVQPSNSTILGAAKVTGHVGAFSIGGLSAVTGQEFARSTTGGVFDPVAKTPVEPATAYSVVRANREFANNSHIGFMLTDTNRRLTENLRFLPDSAVTGGTDVDWRLRNGRYSVGGFWAGSLVRGSANALDELQTSNVHSYQRPDAQYLTYDPARTSLGGHAGSVSFGKITGKKLHFSHNFSYKSPGFDINDLGYQQRADELSMSTWYQIAHDVPGKYVRSVRINFNQWAGWNFGGDLRFSGGNINAHWVLQNNWSFGTGFNVNSQGFADRLTRGGPGGLVQGNVNQWGYINSDERKLVSLNVFSNWFNDQHGSWDVGTSPGITIRPSTALSMNVSLNLDRNQTDAQWVENVADASATHYVFGRLAQTTVGISVRANYTITPNLTVQIYASPFVSDGGYSSFKELTNGRAALYEDRYAPYAYAGNPNFNYHSFRTTNVLRWEYRPGSTLFIVWQQGRDDSGSFGTFRYSRDFHDMFATPATNAFVVKFSRWLNF